MKTNENKNLKEKNIKKIRNNVSIITIFLWIFLVATMVTIMTGNIKNTNAIESENGSVVVKSAFKDAVIDRYRVETIYGSIKLNFKDIEDKGVITCASYGYPVKYEIIDIMNFHPEVATIVSPEENTYVNDGELAITFRPGTMKGTAKISIGVIAYYQDFFDSSYLWPVQAFIDYTVTNETVYGGEIIDPLDLSIIKTPVKEKFKLGEDVSFNITVTNNSNRKISHLILEDDCENFEELIGIVEDFSLEAKESINFLATVEKVQEKHLVDGNKIVNHAYLYTEDGTKIGESTAETTVEKPLLYSSYQVKHEYYKKDKNNNLILEDTVTSDVVDGVIVGSKVGISNENESVDIEVDKILEHTIDGKEYTYEHLESSGNVIIEEDIVKEITLKYVREEKNESDNEIIKNEENVNTSDINVVFYIAVFFISIICCRIIIRKNNKTFKK